MCRNLTVYPTVYLDHASFSRGMITLAGQDFPYNTTTYALTSTNIRDLNNRSFVIHALNLVFTREGNLGFVTLIYDLQGTAGSGNKYEITIPSLTSIPNVLVGDCIANEIGSTVYETRTAMIYNATKIRIVNSNSMNTNNSTSDYLFTAGKRFTGRINFRYTI